MPLKYEVILEVATEGGGMTLLGLPKTKGWLFTMETNDATWTLLDEGASVIHSQSGFVDTLPAALDLMGSRYLWETFHPRVVHPEFRKQIYKTYVQRFKARNIDVSGRVGKWEKICSDTSDKIVYREHALTEVKRDVQ